ncbi:MAG: peptidoglycan DD-metalloendopeptidase family protein [Oscillospiraceae bacterium]|nr:peptidoglycan DD-metalloendopeptidase family protein [Oscillospiraceae bacterium]
MPSYQKNTEPNAPRGKKPLSRFTFSMQRAAYADTALYEELSFYSLYIALGQFLYRIGFEAEYLTREFIRGAKAALHAFWRICKRFGRLFSTAILRAISALTHDAREFTGRILSGFRGIRAAVEEEKQQGNARAAKAGLQYFGRGILMYRHLIANLASYLLPIGAALLFVYTANTMLGYTYALSVEYKGESLGYIANENIYESAQNLVRSRIQKVSGEEDFTAKPTFSISVADKSQLTTDTQIADSLIRTSSDQIQDAVGIYVNDALLGVTTDGALLNSTLEGVKAKYADPARPDIRVEFVKNVQLVPGLYFTTSITDSAAIVNTLTGEVEGQKIYVVQKGDSPQLIAQKNGIPLKDLQALNPHMTEKNYRMPIGDELIVSRQENFLQVKTIEPTTYTQPIPYPTENEETDKLFKNQKKTVRKGVAGTEQITSEIVRIDGVAVEEIVLERVTLQEPVSEVIQIGTKNFTNNVSGGVVGTGRFAYPVPNVTYITTRFGQGGHRGLDICAPYGSPIVAADSGTVVQAGYHYSYGNYVLINHGNGITTRYAHCSALAVGVGSSVSRGQIIGYVGSTGNSSGNHCHFEVMINGSFVNPQGFI